MSLDEILSDEMFSDEKINVSQYKNHLIEKVGTCYQVRQKETNFLIYESNNKESYDEVLCYIDRITRNKQNYV